MEQYTINWLVDKHVVSIKSYQLNADGLATMLDQVNEMVSMSDKPLVHLIFDSSKLESYTKDINAIRKATQNLFSNNQLGWVITIYDNQMIGFLSQVATSIYNIRYRNFNTMEEALMFLQQKDATLPQLL